MKNVPDSHQDLLEDSTRAYAFLATVMPDGSPQVTPVWFNTDGDYIQINSVPGRVKDRNIRARPQVALAIVDLKNPYHFMQVRGTVVEITGEGAREHIDTLAKKYTGREPYTFGPPEEARVIYKISPDRVSVMG